MRAHQIGHRWRSTRGFTLIELMIAVVVVAILASVAFPSFMDSIRKGRRAEAFAALTAVQQAQERWRGNNAAYADTLTSLGLPAVTPGARYDISVVTDATTIATTYEAVATATSGGSQVHDGTCAKLGVRMQGGNLSYAGTGASGTLSYAMTNPCWSR